MIKKESKWKFDTFGTFGGGMGFVAGSSGTIVLDDPTGKRVDFWFRGIGAGLSTPRIKIGNFKMETPGSLTVGPTVAPSMGKLFVLYNLEKDELDQSDIKGPCMFFEAGGGLGVGVSGTMMFVGLDPWFIPFLLSPNPQYNQAFINSAKGVLFMGGVSAYYLPSVGAAVLIGYLD
jgi:hypothetical protein